MTNCTHDIEKVTERLMLMSLPKKIYEEVVDNHKSGACMKKPITIFDLTERLSEYSDEIVGHVKKMSRDQALVRIHELVKSGLQWHDQGLGHGHWEFHLLDVEFIELFEASKVADKK